MNKLILGLMTVVIIANGLVAPALAVEDGSGTPPAQASGGFGQHAKDGLRQVGGENGLTIGDIVTKVINFLLFAVGLVAVIMIIYGAIQYTTSAGDTAKITTAKNTILYAIVGLIVAIIAYSLVNFVITAFVR